MFTVEIPAMPFYARLSGRTSRSISRSDHAMDRTATPAPQDLICGALTEMVPSTAEEIAEAAGLDAATTQLCLDRLAGSYRVMFNPLTKRFSLPKTWHTAGGLAA
jgi:hypothetical protein